QLSRPTREAIVLHHLADMSVYEVAEALGVPVGTVKARLSRGRTMLATLLNERADEPVGSATSAADAAPTPASRSAEPPRAPPPPAPAPAPRPRGRPPPPCGAARAGHDRAGLQRAAGGGRGRDHAARLQPGPPPGPPGQTPRPVDQPVGRDSRAGHARP